MPARIRILTAVNLIAAIVWLLMLLERTSWGRSRVSDYGAAIGPVSLFFLIPCALAFLWLRRRRPEPSFAGRRAYVAASGIFLGATWVLSLIPMIFWAGLVGLGLSHRWPLNLREGPDTAFARERFEEHFRFPPAGADSLYCRRGWEFGDGNTYRMRFHFRDTTLVGSMVRAAGLEPMAESDSVSAWINETGAPGWWPAARPGGARTFRRGDRPRLWVDDAAGVAYYRSSP